MEYIFAITFEIHKYCCLWDTRSLTSKDRNLRSNSWNELSDIFNKKGKQKDTSAFD